MKDSKFNARTEAGNISQFNKDDQWVKRNEFLEVNRISGEVRLRSDKTIIKNLRYYRDVDEVREYTVTKFEIPAKAKGKQLRSIPVKDDVEDYLSEIPEEVIEVEDDDTKPDRETLIEVNGKLTNWDGSDILKTVDHHTNYRISTLGYVMNSKGQYKSSRDSNKKYRDNHQRVDLWQNNIRQSVFLHRLVAEAFIPNPNNLPIVHHIDHNPLNNRVDNLMWMSKEDHIKLHEADRNRGTKAKWNDPEFRERQSAAVKDKWNDPEFRERQSAAVKDKWNDTEFRERQSAAVKEALSMIVEMCNPDTLEVIQTFPSTREAGRITGFSAGNISRACKGQYYGKHIYKNFYWRYKK